MSAVGRVSSIQSLGTVDGPGVRFVAFLQGCNLRCGCCHNPETWDMAGGREYSAQELFSKALRFREYFGQHGGITLSGGEPLLQPQFAAELFTLCRQNGINTCLDTSGSVLDAAVLTLLEVTDYVLLDIKYTNAEQYKAHVGCDLQLPLQFLAVLEERQIPTVIRQVIIPTLNDNAQNISALRDLKRRHSCVRKIELLPFKKLCRAKYENLGLKFPFEDFATPTAEDMKRLERYL